MELVTKNIKWNKRFGIDQFRRIKIQPRIIDLVTRLWEITTEFEGLIPQSLELRSIALGVRLNQLTASVKSSRFRVWLLFGPSTSSVLAD